MSAPRTPEQRAAQSAARAARRARAKGEAAQVVQALRDGSCPNCARLLGLLAEAQAALADALDNGRATTEHLLATLADLAASHGGRTNRADTGRTKGGQNLSALAGTDPALTRTQDPDLFLEISEDQRGESARVGRTQGGQKGGQNLSALETKTPPPKVLTQEGRAESEIVLRLDPPSPLPGHLREAALMGGCTMVAAEQAWDYLLSKHAGVVLDEAQLARAWHLAWTRQRTFERRDAERDAKRDAATKARRDAAADEGYTGPPVSSARVREADLLAQLKARQAKEAAGG